MCYINGVVLFVAIVFCEFLQCLVGPEGTHSWFHQVLDRVVPFCLWLWCICSDRVVLFAAFVYTEFLRCSGRSLSLPNALSHTWGGKLAVIISPRPHIDPFVPSCLFRVFSSCFFPISLLFLSPSFLFSCPPFRFLFFLSSWCLAKNQQATHRHACAEAEKSGQLCWHWACFLLRADVMLPTGFNIFRVDSSISKSYFLILD